MERLPDIYKSAQNIEQTKSFIKAGGSKGFKELQDLDVEGREAAYKTVEWWIDLR